MLTVRYPQRCAQLTHPSRPEVPSIALHVPQICGPDPPHPRHISQITAPDERCYSDWTPFINMSSQVQQLEALLRRKEKLQTREKELLAEIQRRDAADHRKLCFAIGTALVSQVSDPTTARYLAKAAPSLSPRLAAKLKDLLALPPPKASVRDNQNELPLSH